jgi:indolepyruvate ferredoxin oxidoreductase
LSKRIAGATRSQAQFWAESAAITQDLFGSATTSNVFVVGMAVQAGCLPVAADRLEEAIRLNGVAIDSNLAAFRWGRLQIADSEALARARGEAKNFSTLEAAPRRSWVAPTLVARIDALDGGKEGAEALTRYASELVAWGGSGEAARWLDVLDRVQRSEESARPGSRRLVCAVAASLYKLMAYKDEYEVARLMIDQGTMAEARRLAGRDGRIVWKLHPPLLRALGLRRKISFGLWATPFFRLLARARFLRGTVCDPFGHAKLRRMERELPREYIEMLDRILARLESANLEAAVAVAELPNQIRGYEDLKLERVARYRETLTAAEVGFGL